jgi:hypothetical protein
MFFERFLCAAVLLFATAAKADDFILSYWCGPPPDKDVDQRYAEVAECGFNYAMIPCSGASVEGHKAILDACKKHHLKYIAHDPRLLSFGRENPAFATNLDAIISEFKNYLALGGYFLADEPGPGAFPLLGAVNQYLLAHDSKHLPFINLLPNYAGPGALGGDYEEHVEKYLNTVKPRLLSFDHYALMTDGSLRPNYFDNLEIIRRQSLKHDVPFCFIFQETPHFSYRNPSEADLRWQVNTALAYGAKALMYFTYWTPTNDPAFRATDAIIDRNGKRSPHFEQAKRINTAVRKWAPTLMKLKSTAVYHVGKLPAGTSALPNDAAVHFNGSAELIVGFFKHQDGSEWCMVMNRDIRNEANVVARFDDKVKRVRELSSTKGKLSTAKLRDHELQLSLAAGGAQLFQLSR